ncbi:MAG: hypothetical protein QM737_19855 [Ferruginibacter sp.]
MKKAILFFLFSYCIATSWAQVGIGTTTPVPSAALEIKDTTRGLLIPRMTMIQRNAISTPATGLMVYQTDSTKGFWYFDGAVWKNVNTTSANPNYGGKPVLILSDSLTNAQAAAKVAAEFGPNTQEIRIKNCINLTYVDLSMFTTVSSITVTDNPVLQILNLSNLKICNGYFNFNNCPLLTTLNLNSLEKVYHMSDLESIAFYFNNVKLSSIDCPNLKAVLGTMQITNNSYLTSLSFPLLSANLMYLFVYSNVNLQTISFPSLTKIGVMTITTNNALTSINMSSLSGFTLGITPAGTVESRISLCPHLTTIVFGNMVTFYNLGFGTYGSTALSVATVNDLLHSFASMNPPVSGKTFRFSGQTPPAPPSGQGITDKAFLIAHGNSVQTD